MWSPLKTSCLGGREKVKEQEEDEPTEFHEGAVSSTAGSLYYLQ